MGPPVPPTLVVQPDGMQLCTARMDAEWAAAVAAAGAAGEAEKLETGPQGGAAAPQRRWWGRRQQQEPLAAAAAGGPEGSQVSLELAAAPLGAPPVAAAAATTGGSSRSSRLDLEQGRPETPLVGAASSSSVLLQPQQQVPGGSLGRHSSGSADVLPGGSSARLRMLRASTGAQLVERQAQLAQRAGLNPRPRRQRTIPMFEMQLAMDVPLGLSELGQQMPSNNVAAGGGGSLQAASGDATGVRPDHQN